jgi:hypothetical protein
MIAGTHDMPGLYIVHSLHTSCVRVVDDQVALFSA